MESFPHIPAELRSLSRAYLICLTVQWIPWTLRDYEHWNEGVVMSGSIIICVQQICRIIGEQGRFVVYSPCKTTRKIHDYYRSLEVLNLR